MARSKSFITARSLTIEEQILRMQSVCPWFKLRRVRRQVEATWIGEVHPTPLCDLYTVSLRHRTNWCPEVRVQSPALRIRQEQNPCPTFTATAVCVYTHYQIGNPPDSSPITLSLGSVLGCISMRCGSQLGSGLPVARTLKSLSTVTN